MRFGKPLVVAVVLAAFAAGAGFASVDDTEPEPEHTLDTALSSRTGGRADDDSPDDGLESAPDDTSDDAPATTVTRPAEPSQPDSLPVADGARALEFYGMEWSDDLQPGDLEAAAALGVDTIMIDFDGNDPDRWVAQLDDAERLGLSVVANYWPGRPAWTRTASGWDIPESSADFVRTVADHPALLAVYLLHEPYWNDGNGISTAEQRDLYQRVKAIADVPLYSAFAWSAFEQAKWTTGICDYCDTWFYPSEFDNDYNGAELERKLENILNHFNAQAGGTDIKLVWILQAFESERAGKQMPTYDEMIRLADTAINYRASSGQQVDAVFWYTWRHGSEYQEVLGNHPELQPAVREVRDRFVG